MSELDEKYRIELDLDRNRIKSILSEAYDICADTLGVEFFITAEEFVSKINPHLESNRVAAVPVLLGLPSSRHPEMGIEINIKKKKIIARMANKKLRILLNRYLTKL